jgi:hypothetical protein
MVINPIEPGQLYGNVLKARILWRDSVHVIEACEHAASESDFRTYWFCSIAMLRAIGHVLKKYDARDNPKAATVVESLWLRWESDPQSRACFFDFLETERNQSLKEYEFAFYSGGHMLPIVVNPHEAGVISELSVDIYRPIELGPYAGMDARDVLKEIHEWWDTQLTEVESTIECT